MSGMMREDVWDDGGCLGMSGMMGEDIWDDGGMFGMMGRCLG